MSHPDPTREYEEEFMGTDWMFEQAFEIDPEGIMRGDDERESDDEQQQGIEAERFWRSLEIYQSCKAGIKLNAPQLEDLRIFLGLSKGDL